jgi:hypothetical protein
VCVLRLAGRTLTTGPETFGIVVFEALDLAAASAVMTGDPAVAGGVMTAEVFPFRVALAVGSAARGGGAMKARPGRFAAALYTVHGRRRGRRRRRAWCRYTVYVLE